MQCRPYNRCSFYRSHQAASVGFSRRHCADHWQYVPASHRHKFSGVHGSPPRHGRRLNWFEHTFYQVHAPRNGQCSSFRYQAVRLNIRSGSRPFSSDCAQQGTLTYALLLFPIRNDLHLKCALHFSDPCYLWMPYSTAVLTWSRYNRDWLHSPKNFHWYF